MSGGDWVPCQGFGEASLLGPNDTVNILLVAPRDSNFNDPAEVATVDESTAVLSMRVVGCVLISSAAEAAFVGERIRVGIYDNVGANAFYANSLTDANDANEPFLWQRYQSINYAGPNAQAAFHPYWSLVDVRVSRRIEMGQALFYTASTLTVGEAVVQPFLRTYARTLG